MDWMNNFLIPLVKTIVLLSFILGLLYLGLRKTIHQYSVKTKFDIKYKKNSQPSKKHMEVLQALPYNLEIPSLKKELLTSGLNLNEVNEIIYLYKRFGGIQNGR